ncbi:tubulin binding cofactor A [Cokeromyces recurvatus]|uniref:tubulin binding cofactor A n=1 Tax=Cokeromyces recurvatus TaxID=90255 RepID=UPI00222014F6|nr:tubulin binding cofactor A [Cokeromyces recurvatus]KAI7898907.1 tubulin binding cofactor A [Cokeromyces recurvatus]
MPLSPLKIKTNVVKRIYKEHLGYLKEAETQQKRIDKLIAEGADEADVRKQKEVLAETQQMIPDVKKRLANAYQDLQNQLENFENAAVDEIQEAQTVISQISIIE